MALASLGAGIADYHIVLSGLAAALEARDPYTRTHSRNVAHFATKLAEKMGLDQAQVDEIHLSFDAMVSDRPYRNALAFEEALDELKRMSGDQLDPTCVCAFLELVQEDPELIDMRQRDRA